MGWSGAWVRYSTWRRRLCTPAAASRMVFAKSHKVGTGTGGKKTAVAHQLHAPQVDLPISFYCIFDGIPGFGEGRRIQDHHVKLPPLGLQLREKFENIGAAEFYPVRKAVKRSVFPGLIDGQLGGIHAKNRCCSCNACI